MKVFFTLFLLFSIVFTSAAQVNEIRNELEKDKNEQKLSKGSSGGTVESTDCSSEPPNLVSGLDAITGIFRLIGGIAIIQERVLKAKDKHPGIVSAEVLLHGGYGPKHEGVLLSPRVRLNWGIFSTEFRNQRIFDGTDLLDTYDWQILKINLPLYAVRLTGGLGFTQIPEAGLSYLEYTIHGLVRFYKEKAVVDMGYRWTQLKNDRRFREEFKTTLDYEIKNFPIGKKSAIRLSPLAGFVYQNYFAGIEQFYWLGGLNIRFY